MDVIPTPRLDLIALTPAFLAVSLAGQAQTAEEMLGAAIPGEWYAETGLMRMRKDQLEQDASLQPWLVRALVLRPERQMVGYIGFHDRPGAVYLQPFAPGGAEIGYTVFSAFRRQGFAREACQSLMDWAHRQYGVNRFVVSISATNVASLRLAAGFGFERVGSHIDEEDGPEDIFVLQVPPVSSENSAPSPV